ncbi:hypothetical protein [Serratia sp. AKBS12]|uniref:hypothetical protein n=1 Tax=Serratia sp. AKBS12 TaxID=2974597 RepID=UPI0021650B38|nr:hypothetical protein [Serratia sp. AKBS12]MCS3409262.1 hypothetical protein [Serratia sp. AKBS12]HEI8865587.1 hypothetical protein [Serratia odorifera]
MPVVCRRFRLETDCVSASSLPSFPVVQPVCQTLCAGIISSSYDVFANAQRIVKVKEAKSEERTVKKSQRPIFGYESLVEKAWQIAA